MTILDKIVRDKKAEVEIRKKHNPLSGLKNRPELESGNNSLREKMDSCADFHFICEVKKASPSKGIIRQDFDPLRIAGDYASGGASAISVLTDEKYFCGHLDYLTQIRSKVSLPLLRKDFIIDPYQIYESKIAGADIILLIARCLDADHLREFTDLARTLRLDVLIELAEEKEIQKLPPSAKHVILGINNRNLANFEVDFSRSLELIKNLPGDTPVIAESGITSVSDCKKLFKGGFRGALIGETLMRSDDPQKLLTEFIDGVHDARLS